MAQGHRIRHFANSGSGVSDTLTIRGTYSLDLKVTIEWERSLALVDLAALVLPFLRSAQDFRSIRNHLSGQLVTVEEISTGERISDFRLSRRSTLEIMGALSSKGLVRQVSAASWRAVTAEQ